ncbi:DDE-type integrase/transposase/recombinase [Listeria booriae]|nr:DDE-type integrase/transposase/recombinase [Listeria booriae]
MKTVLEKYPGILLLHSDRGSQYTTAIHHELLTENKVIASYSKAGYPSDNAKIKSYHARIKREKLYQLDFQHITMCIKLYLAIIMACVIRNVFINL